MRVKVLAQVLHGIDLSPQRELTSKAFLRPRSGLGYASGRGGGRVRARVRVRVRVRLRFGLRKIMLTC